MVETMVFTFLWLVWAALLFGGFAFGTLNEAETRRMPDWTRMGSSLTLVAAAWLWYGSTGAGPARPFTLWVAIGMSLGCLGDFFMAGLVVSNRETATLCGMGSFGLGHVAYIAGFLLFGSACGLTEPIARGVSWLAWLAVGVIGWYYVVFRHATAPTPLDWAALPYSLLLASTAGLATGLAVQERTFLPLACGAALFLLSDLILAGQMFRKAHFRLINDVVWLTYGPGQMLIVYAAAAALRVAAGRTASPLPVSGL